MKNKFRQTFGARRTPSFALWGGGVLVQIQWESRLHVCELTLLLQLVENEGSIVVVLVFLVRR